jgi:hypothetical protein
MKIRSKGAEFIHADTARRTDSHSANAPTDINIRKGNVPEYLPRHLVTSEQCPATAPSIQDRFTTAMSTGQQFNTCQALGVPSSRQG